MAGFYTHHVFGRELIPLLSQEDQRTIRDHRKAFDLGLQGPDVFFFDQRSKTKTAAFGNALHRRSFIQILEKFPQLPDDPSERAYFYGFFAHFLLDSTVHPAVREWEEKGEDHIALETEWDKRLLDRDGFYPEKYPSYILIPEEKDVEPGFGKFWQKFGVLSRETPKEALRSMKKVKRHLFTPGPLKYHIVRRVLLSTGKRDFLGVLLYGPNEPRWDPAIQQFTEKYKEALDSYAGKLEEVKRYFTLGEISPFMNENFG